MTKPFIGLKRLWYGDVITAVEHKDTGLTIEEILVKVESCTEIKNVHQDTWGYEETDPTVTEYINELTGKPYYRDAQTQGVPTMSFTLGQYAFSDKAALQGGTAMAAKWDRPNEIPMIEKCIIAQTKTGTLIVFPRANIIGKGNFVEKNIGLGVSAVPLDTNVDGLSSESWFKDVEIG